MAGRVDRNVAGDQELRDGQRVVFDVGVVRQDVAHDVGVFSARGGVDGADRRVVDRGDGDRQLSRVGQGAIGERVGGDRDAAVPVADRRERVGAVGVDRQRTLVGDGRGLTGGLRLTINRELRHREVGQDVVEVGIVGEDIARGGRVFVGCTRVVRADRRVVDRGDRERERRGRGEGAVGQRVGDDWDAAVPVGDRREDVGTIGVDLDGALRGDRGGGSGRVDRDVAVDRELRHGERVLLDVGVVRQDVTDDIGILGARVRIDRADRSVVDCRDAQGERRLGCQVRVLHRVDDGRDGTVPVQGRREGVAAVGVDDQRALTRNRGRGASRVGGAVAGDLEVHHGEVSEHIVDVGVVREDIAGEGRVFGAGARIVDRDRGGVDRRERQVEITRVGELAIGDRVGDGRDSAVVVLFADEEVAAVGGDGNRALAGDGGRLTGGVDRVVAGDLEGGDRQRVIVAIDIVREDVSADHSELGTRLGVVVRFRSVVGVDHRDGQGARRREEAAVGVGLSVLGRVGEDREVAAVILGRADPDVSVRGDRDGTLSGDRGDVARVEDLQGAGDAIRVDTRDREGRDRAGGAGVDVGVVGEDVGRAAIGEGRGLRRVVFGDRDRVIDRQRRVVDDDLEGSTGSLRLPMHARRKRVGDAVDDLSHSTGEAGDRGEGPNARGSNIDGALPCDDEILAGGSPSHTVDRVLQDAERIGIDVAVVRLHVAAQDGILATGSRIADRDRHVIDRLNGDRKGRGHRAARVIRDEVSDDRGDAVPITEGRERVSPVATEFDRPLTRDGRGRRGVYGVGDGVDRVIASHAELADAKCLRVQVVAQGQVNVGLVLKDIARDGIVGVGRAFKDIRFFRGGDDHIIDRIDGEGEGGTFTAVAVLVAGNVPEFQRTVPIGIGRETIDAVEGIYRDGTRAEVAGSAILASRVDIHRRGEVREFDFIAILVQVEELLDGDGRRGGVQRQVGVDVGVVGDEAARYRGGFVDHRGIVSRNRGIRDGIQRDGEGRGNRVVALVDRREGDDQVAVPIGARREGIETVRIDLKSADATSQVLRLSQCDDGLSVCGSRDDGERFARAIRDVVHVSSDGDVEKTSDDLGGVLIDRSVAVGNHEGIVHRGDGDRERRGGAMGAIGVGCREIDDERAVPMLGLGEDVGTVAVQAEDALTRQGRVGVEREVRRAHRGRRDGQRLGGAVEHVIDVGAVGVGQDGTRGAGRFVFDDGHATRLSGEVIVHSGHRERERRGRRATVIVGHMVSDHRDGAVPVAGRSE